MKDIDRLIDKALDEEERDLLRRIGEEPGFFSQAFGIFSGKTGWVNAVLVAAQTFLFLAGLWTAWMFFLADDVVTQLRWGLPAVVLLILAAVIKMTAFWPAMQTNRLLRELRLIELQLARSADRTGKAG